MAGVSVRNLTRRPEAPRAAFSAVAAEVLPGWDVSLVFVSPARARALNKSLRGKTYTPNVLSYTLAAKSGEIFICLAEAEKQAPRYEMTPSIFILFLFIHGTLHLKGRAHGSTMEQCEQNLLAKFAKSSVRAPLHVTTHSNRNRHRHVPSKAGRRRGAR